jgi:uncharacterized membrane protein YeaQ/YmgE (transglycosylase-associated protein family)
MLSVVILIIAMIAVGVIIGALADPIWKGQHPIGVTGDYIAAIISTVAVGLLDWYVIPAMGFSQTMKYLGVAIEPAAMALIVLWVIRRARK